MTTDHQWFAADFKIVLPGKLGEAITGCDSLALASGQIELNMYGNWTDETLQELQDLMRQATLKFEGAGFYGGENDIEIDT